MLKVGQNLISFLPYDIDKLTRLESLNCQRNHISRLPSSITQLEMLEDLEISENPLIFPPLSIASRGLVHILAYISKNEDPQETGPGHDHELSQTTLNQRGEASPQNRPPSPSPTLPSSAMDIARLQKTNLMTPKQPGSSPLTSYFPRRLSCTPEYIKQSSDERVMGNCTPSPCSSSEGEESAMALHQPRFTKNMRKIEQENYLCSSFPTITQSPLREMNQTRSRLFSDTDERPQPVPRKTLSPHNAHPSKLYVRRTTPSPPPRRPRLSRPMGSESPEDARRTPSPLPPLPKRHTTSSLPPNSIDLRIARVRPFLFPQRSFSPAEDSLSSVTPDGSPQGELRPLHVLQPDAWATEFARLPRLSRQTTETSADVGEDSDDLSTDSSYEDLPVPRLRGRNPQGISRIPGHHSLRRPGESVPPTAVSSQHQQEFVKHSQTTGFVNSKFNGTRICHQQSSSPIGRDLHRAESLDASLAISCQKTSIASVPHEHVHGTQAIYPQAPDYADLWRSTAEHLHFILVSRLNVHLPSTPQELANELKTGVHLAQFLNNLLGYKAVKKVYEATGASWQYRARQNLFHCREVIRQVGIPKHRLFSVSRLLAADTTVGLFGLLHCLQTLVEVWTSKTSAYMVGGLRVREKLSSHTTASRSIIGDITARRYQRHRPASARNYIQSGGVFSDV
uniref:Calponin-homology (CH) domain-containing protein n=1 Tax=Mesocestoides corti TaxID=53468 RepID=A0A5K3EPT8_MESCO